MKKYLVLIFSLLLIFSMFLSMFYVKMTGKYENGVLGINGDDSEGDTHEQNLQINIVKEPQALHPGMATDSISKSVLLQTFEGLSRIDIWGQRVNGAVKAIKISDDQKTYTFILRDSKWTNGDPVIAKDFEYAWKWVLDPNNHSGNANQLYYLEGAKEFNEGTGSSEEVGVKAINDKTLEVKLVEPTANFLELTALHTYFPVNSKIAEKYPDWANGVSELYTSNGPFEMKEWTHGEKIELIKNKNYWDLNTVKLKTITMYMVNDPITQLSMFESGEIDWTGVTTGQLPLGTEDPLSDGMLYSQPGAGTYAYRFNTKVEPFNNRNIRKAFALAINRQQIVDHVIEKGQLRAMSLLPPSLESGNEKGYFKDHDVQLAKKYLKKGLKELGIKDISELPKIKLSINNSETDKKIALAIQKMWNEYLGGEIIVDESDWETLNKNVGELNYHVAQMSILTDLNDPINVLEMYLDAGTSNNDIGWENKRFNNFIKQLQTETDGEKRKELHRKAEAALIEEMPVVPIYFYTIDYFMDGELKDVGRSGIGQVQYKWAYFQ